jgi:hypothetical protein
LVTGIESLLAHPRLDPHFGHKIAVSYNGQKAQPKNVSRFVEGVMRIAQLLVSTFLLFLLAACDTVRLTNGGSGENGVLVDGTTGGSSHNDDRYTAAAGSNFSVSNYSGSGEIVAYTNDHPPTLKPNVSWSGGSDTVDVNFENKYLVPFFVWIIQGAFSTQQMVAINACVRTSQIWHDERQGISFSTFNILDATANSNAGSFLAFDCSKASNMKTQIGFNNGGVNVYYVNTVDFDSGAATTNGVWCGGNVVAMGKDASDHLFSHEIGHAFSLEHVNTLTTFFDTTNVMHNASNDRRFLTEGQTFRAVVNSSSSINTVYNARPGLVTRPCTTSTDTTNAQCPAIQKRIWADGTNWPPN